MTVTTVMGLLAWYDEHDDYKILDEAGVEWTPVGMRHGFFIFRTSHGESEFTVSGDGFAFIDRKVPTRRLVISRRIFKT